MRCRRSDIYSFTVGTSCERMVYYFEWCTTSNIVVSHVRVISGLLNNGGCRPARDLCTHLFYSLYLEQVSL